MNSTCVRKYLSYQRVSLIFKNQKTKGIESGTIKSLVDKYQNGQLTPTASASALAYAAMGGMGAERGRGMGRGRATGVRGMGVEVLAGAVRDKALQCQIGLIKVPLSL